MREEHKEPVCVIMSDNGCAWARFSQSAIYLRPKPSFAVIQSWKPYEVSLTNKGVRILAQSTLTHYKRNEQHWT